MKRTIRLFLALALILGLAACGGGESWEEQYDLGVRYLSEGNYEEAILAFTAAIEIDPQRPEAYTGRGDASVLSGETAETLAAALADYEAALDLDEGLAAAWLGLTDVYIRMGDYDTALEVIREAAEHTDDPAVRAKLEDMEQGIFDDSSGDLRQISSYDPSGALIWRQTFTYDDQGRQASVTSYDGAGAQTGHVDLAYDGAGNQTVDYQYITDTGQVGRVERTFDGGTEPVTEAWYSGEGELIMSFQKEYGPDGTLLSETQYGPEGEVENTRTFTYDDQGRTIRHSDYGPDGSLAGYYVFEYDQRGEISRIADYDGDGTLRGYDLHRYDEAGNYLGTETYDGGGSLVSTTVNE